jgi:hypothetical protein
MPQRITRFSVGQTAKVFGIMYAIIGVIIMPIFFLASALSPEGPAVGMGFALALPILYGGAGLVFTALACWIYNWVAGWAGGIEVELGNAPES